jgi:DNA-binding MarR family transcriptional regulator
MTRKQIEHALIDADLTVTALARKLGYARTSVSRAISGDERYHIVRRRVVNYLKRLEPQAA